MPHDRVELEELVFELPELVQPVPRKPAPVTQPQPPLNEQWTLPEPYRSLLQPDPR